MKMPGYGMNERDSFENDEFRSSIMGALTEFVREHSLPELGWVVGLTSIGAIAVHPDAHVTLYYKNNKWTTDKGDREGDNRKEISETV